jgi:hypothetical protein
MPSITPLKTIGRPRPDRVAMALGEAQRLEPGGDDEVDRKRTILLREQRHVFGTRARRKTQRVELLRVDLDRARRILHERLAQRLLAHHVHRVHRVPVADQHDAPRLDLALARRLRGLREYAGRDRQDERGKEGGELHARGFVP